MYVTVKGLADLSVIQQHNGYTKDQMLKNNHKLFSCGNNIPEWFLKCGKLCKE